ncbi:MAG: hypothetical protein ABIA04_08820 [Pseudomonadota bacterium]
MGNVDRVQGRKPCDCKKKKCDDKDGNREHHQQGNAQEKRAKIMEIKKQNEGSNF